ncbi:50S ribosomal protein L6 [Candidatus Woesearchaeota archaeon]|nr:50S ribosomal protein L6 [Candidatus Woesearchaeota archaeon]
MKEDLKQEIELPADISINIDRTIKVTGPQGEVEKALVHPKIKITHQDTKVILESKRATKTEKKILNSFCAHIKNMLRGVTEKHTYKLKICSGHFPMNVSLSNDQFTVKNFLGESVPRKLTIKQGAELKVEGSEIIITSTSKETAGQVAADIEQLTKVKNRDLRIFQDGIWITHKDGKEL